MTTYLVAYQLQINLSLNIWGMTASLILQTYLNRVLYFTNVEYVNIHTQRISINLFISRTRKKRRIVD